VTLTSSAGRALKTRTQRRKKILSNMMNAVQPSLS
jgi:hypothetical protein